MDEFQTITLILSPGRATQSVARLTKIASGSGFDLWSGHILSFLLPLIKEGHLPVSGESVCTKYC